MSHPWTCARVAVPVVLSLAGCLSETSTKMQAQTERWASMHPTTPRTGRILEVSGAYLWPRVVALLGVAGAAWYVNREFFWTQKPDTITPEFLEEVARVGPVAVSAIRGRFMFRCFVLQVQGNTSEHFFIPLTMILLSWSLLMTAATRECPSRLPQPLHQPHPRQHPWPRGPQEGPVNAPRDLIFLCFVHMRAGMAGLTQLWCPSVSERFYSGDISTGASGLAVDNGTYCIMQTMRPTMPAWHA